MSKHRNSSDRADKLEVQDLLRTLGFSTEGIKSIIFQAGYKNAREAVDWAGATVALIRDEMIEDAKYLGEPEIGPEEAHERAIFALALGLQAFVRKKGGKIELFEKNLSADKIWKGVGDFLATYLPRLDDPEKILSILAGARVACEQGLPSLVLSLSKEAA